MSLLILHISPSEKATKKPLNICIDSTTVCCTRLCRLPGVFSGQPTRLVCTQHINQKGDEWPPSVSGHQLRHAGKPAAEVIKTAHHVSCSHCLSSGCSFELVHLADLSDPRTSKEAQS